VEKLTVNARTSVEGKPLTQMTIPEIREFVRALKKQHLFTIASLDALEATITATARTLAEQRAARARGQEAAIQN
jgi:hypothetical protein